MMDFMSKQKSHSGEEKLTSDCLSSLSSDESLKSISLSFGNFEQLLNSHNNQHQTKSSDDVENEVIDSNKAGNNLDSTRKLSPQESQQSAIFDNSFISFLFKQNEISNGISNAKDISNNEEFKQMDLTQYKNDSHSSLPIEQSNVECNLLKNNELLNSHNNYLNIISSEEDVSKTIIENCSRQKNQEEEIFNAFAANIQLQSYFVQMMQTMMTNMGQDNIDSITLTRRADTIPQQNASKESSNDTIKNVESNLLSNQLSNKKLINDDEPLDLSNKKNLPTMNCNSGSSNSPTTNNNNNEIIKNNIITQTFKLQEQLLQNGALSLLPYAFQSQTLNKNSTNTISNKWTSPRGAANRRTYTQADLEAAVNDIRSGKLGTRRASVVYGIPRSTLRNKIYKLESATANPADILIIGKKKKKVLDNDGKEKDEDRSPFGPMTESEFQLSKLLNTNESMNVANLIVNKSPKDDESLVNCVGDINLNNLQSQSSLLPLEVKQKEGSEKRLLSRENSFNKVYFGEGSTSRNSSENGDNSNPDGLKKSRPKRGQYRKYDKDALDEAVKSVRRGEMSVHRAGSFFGVPHSTLEYKVKERNLLRIKKRQKSFDEYNSEEKESLIVEKKNITPTKSQPPSNVLSSLVTSWNMFPQNSENILASITPKPSINK